MINNRKTAEYAQRIAVLLDAGLVATANDLYAVMLREMPMVKWEQIAFGDQVRSLRKSCKIFVSICEDKEVYRLSFHGKHIGYFDSKEALDSKIAQLLF